MLDTAQYHNLEKMRQGVDQRFLVRMRGFSMLVRPLSIYEQNLVASEVLADLERKPKSQQNNMMETSLLAIKSLAKASTSDIDKTDPQVGEIELQRLTAQEIEFLWAEYVSACEKLNPRLEVMTPKEVNDLVEECKKKEDGVELALAKLSFWQVWNIARHLSTTPGERPQDK
jgi:hypothetical protein